MKLALIIPALNEEGIVARTVARLPAGLASQLIVVDNGSTDATADRACEAGAEVVSEPRRGYGQACLAGLAVLRPDIEAVGILDADGSDDALKLPGMLALIEKDEADMVLTARVLGDAVLHLTPQQRFGNWLACWLIRVGWGYRYRDMGPMRIIRRSSFEATVPVGASDFAGAVGGGLSGVVPFRLGSLTDRFIFQINGGKGTARYLNDLSSLGGQDAVFDSMGTLHALPVLGWYIDYEHMWKSWSAGRNVNLRSSVIWSYVAVDNFDIQPGDAYAHTNRFVANVIFTPEPRLDIGIEYIWGSRKNKDGSSGTSDQIQFVALFLF